VLDELRRADFYPRFGLGANLAIAGRLHRAAIVSGVYLHVEHYDIVTVRAGVWSDTDLAMGAIMVA
jgi:hypothetical protein